MPVLRRIAVLQTGSAHLPSTAQPDPRRAIEVRAGEDTDLFFEVLDDGGSPVAYKTDDQLQLTVRPTPAVDDEKLLRLFASPSPLDGPNIWKLTLTAQLTKQKSSQFSRAFYDLCLISATGRRDYVIETSPFRLLGAPGAP